MNQREKDKKRKKTQERQAKAREKRARRKPVTIQEYFDSQPRSRVSFMTGQNP